MQKTIPNVPSNVLRINFNPAELVNEAKKNYLDGKCYDGEPVPGKTLVKVVENTNTKRVIEILATTNAESASTFMISGVKSLANDASSSLVPDESHACKAEKVDDGTIILSSDED